MPAGIYIIVFFIHVNLRAPHRAGICKHPAFNICINAVAPGLTLSLDDVDDAGMKQYEQRAQAGCIKRVETPQDLVGTIVFLSSAESDFITGQTIAVNGGSAML